MSMLVSSEVSPTKCVFGESAVRAAFSQEAIIRMRKSQSFIMACRRTFMISKLNHENGETFGRAYFS